MATTTTPPDLKALRKPHDDEVDVYGLTHAGRVRKENQDHFLICSVRKQVLVHNTSLPSTDRLPLSGERMAFLAVVADGVGSGAGGEAASRLALEGVTEYVALTMRAYHDLDSADDVHFLEGLQEAAWKCHAYRRSTAEPFAPCHTGQAQEYDVLALARGLAGDEVALRCISIGGPQIMGFNFGALGYQSAVALYDAFQASEAAQVRGFLAYCARRGLPGQLLGAVRNHDWPTFARLYNGDGNVPTYAALLSSAFDDAQQLF